jgi:uncharacterized Fe-S center protein
LNLPGKHDILRYQHRPFNQEEEISLKEEVFLIKITDNEDDKVVCEKLTRVLRERELFYFVEPKDMVAIKTHFGEENSSGYVRPLYFKAVGDLLKEKRAQPFLTETSTLYRGKRSNAVEHILHAYSHGFTPQHTGLPIIMADGLMGDQEIEVSIPGKLYKKVGIASLIVKSQAVIMVSHFTGHMLSGFGATLKNMGMGCASRKGKLIQHSTAQPSIKISSCTGCGECIKWCPAEAISLVDGKAFIKKKTCIGCGECLAVCRFDAVGYNWGETYENVQKKMVEHAMGVAMPNKGKIMYINFLNRITRDCDCMGKFEKVMPDIGVLIGFDPVAVDSAALYLAEELMGRKLSTVTFNVPYKVQLDYAKEIGLGSTDFQLIEC